MCDIITHAIRKAFLVSPTPLSHLSSKCTVVDFKISEYSRTYYRYMYYTQYW